MAPIIHLVRHAQGFHNLSVENQQLPDPDLTPLVASPIRRTLWTCLRSFDPVVKSGKKVIALPDAQEISNFPCDHGSEPEKLQEEFGDLVDLSLVQKGWNNKASGSRYYPAPDKLEERSREVRKWLRNLASKAGEDAQIVLVTHGGILHFLTGDWDGVKLEKGTGWENTEVRSYEFENLTGQDPEATLKETQSSWRRRRGSAIPLTETEQIQIRQAFQALLDELTQADKVNGSEEAVSD